MHINSLEDLYMSQLRDIYDAENRILEGLEKMEQEASSDDLKEAYRRHHEETQNQIDRLEKIFETLDVSPEGQECQAMVGLIEEGDEIMSHVDDKKVLDAALISAAQKIEHYEIATYGTLKTLAKMLGHDDSADLLEETLEEEKKTDMLLTDLAIKHINQQAAGA